MQLNLTGIVIGDRDPADEFRLEPTALEQKLRNVEPRVGHRAAHADLIDPMQNVLVRDRKIPERR